MDENSEKTRIVEVLRLLFRSSEEEVITKLTNNLDLLDVQFGYGNNKSFIHVYYGGALEVVRG